MHTMAWRSAFLLLFLFLIPISPSKAAAGADHQSDDLTISTRPLKATDPLGLILNLPLLQPGERPHLLLKHDASPPQAKGKEEAVELGLSCYYTVTIKTSCSSPRVTHDAVSLTFGDAYRNEVYAGRLDDPASRTFERCSIDTFRIVGPCGGRTCYLYLRRSGRDGWIPEYVKVFYSPRDPRAAVTFFYKVSLPDGVWYGFNICYSGAAAMPGTLTPTSTSAG